MTDRKPKRAAIYARISETDDKVDKPANQVTSCKRFIATNEYVLNDENIYSDEISASRFLHRPGYAELVEAAARGDFDVIVAVAEDRLSRQPKEKLLLLAACEEAGVIWHTIADGVIDPKSDEGELFAYFRGWIGRKEQRDKSRRQREAFQLRQEQGLPLWGCRPFGFELDRMTHRLDEVEELRLAYESILAGGTIYALIKDWNSRGVLTSTQRDAPAHLARLQARLKGRAPTDNQQKKLDRLRRYVQDPPGWSYAGVQQLLKRPRNAALMSTSIRNSDAKQSQTGRFEINEGVPAKWEPIVSREDWEAACIALADNAKMFSQVNQPRWLMAGIAKCGVCGSVMRSATGSDRNGSFKTYRCAAKSLPHPADSRRHSSVKIEQLDGLVANAIATSFLLSPLGATESLAVRSDVAEMGELRAQLYDVRRAKADVTELIGEPDWPTHKLKEKMAKLAAQEAETVRAIETIARRSAHAAMLADARQDLLAARTPRMTKSTDEDKLLGVIPGKRQDTDLAARVKHDLIRKFLSLDLPQQRTLVQALLVVTVYPGRTLNRIDVHHLGRDDLNSI